MVDAQRRGPLSTQGIEAHQVTVGRLVQRVMAHETPSNPDSGVIITLLLQKYNQAFRGLEEQLAKAISFRQYPFIVATGQQVATIEVQRLLERPPPGGRILNLFRLLCPGEGLLKFQDIEGPGVCLRGR